jgi:two-component system cell cycle sensor histidine kinase/response regulator CckA
MSGVARTPEGSSEVLRGSESHLRQIVTTCLEGVWTVDAAGLTTFVNPQMASMLGWEVEEIVGRPVSDFVDSEGRDQLARQLERRRLGIREQHEFAFLRRDGRKLFTLMSTSPLYEPDGSYGGALAVVTDVSERRAFDLKLQSMQRLESLTLLAGGVAHDFNNLLVGILGNLALALAELPKDSFLHEAIQDAQTAALRASELTKQMLAYSGKGRFVLERLDVSHVVEELLPLLMSVVSKNAELVLALADKLPEINVDPAQLRQLVLNLVTNGSDALGERAGAITLKTGVMTADRTYLDTVFLGEEVSEGSYVYIEISDTGRGMEPETLGRIFDPFFSTKFMGRGLGLAAVFGILRAHHGAIHVQSKPDEGASFRALFAAAAPEARSTVSVLPETGFRGSGLILVADDEETVRTVAARILVQNGFRVLIACDGEEALSMFEHEREIAAVVLDVTMPGVGSEKVFRSMRNLRANVPVILTSGYSEKDVTSAFAGEGLAGFLQKPWLPDDLLRSLRRVLGGAPT